MKTFTIQKLYNNTIPLRESVVNILLKQGEDLQVELGGKKWVLTVDALKHPLRHIVTTTKSDKPTKIYYYSLPNNNPQQGSLL